jgi:hypothetical protein
MIGDHPEIEYAMRTGYPSWNQPVQYYCEECGRDITDETAYEDEAHSFLCRACLLTLHEKPFW